MSTSSSHTPPPGPQLIDGKDLFSGLKLNQAAEIANRSTTGPEDPTFTKYLPVLDEELYPLLDDDVKTGYSAVLPLYIQGKLHALRASAAKRKAPTLSSPVKTRKLVDGRTFLRYIKAGEHPEINFPDMLFTTRDHVAEGLPLGWFLNDSLLYLNKGGTLPSLKANSNGDKIFDVEKISAILGNEDDLISETTKFEEASRNFHRFEQEVDAEGPAGDWSTNLQQHFTFFITRTSRAQHFHEWRLIEQINRKDIFTKGMKYKEQKYLQDYKLMEKMKNVALELEKKWAEKIESLETRMAAPNPKPFRAKEPSSSSPGSSKSSKGRLVCLLCARSHTVNSHKMSHPTKLPNGKPFYSSYHNNVLRAPDGTTLCIPFNVGKEHSNCKASHRCALCGENHKAVDFECHERSSA